MARRGTIQTAALVTLTVLAVAAIAAIGPMAALARQNPLSSAGTALALGIPFGAVGVIIALRQPRNPIGWMSLVFAVCFIGSVDASSYSIAAYRLGRAPGVAPVLFLQGLWLPALTLLPLMILLFPDGRLPSPRWRWPMWAYVALWGFFQAGQYTTVTAAIVTHHIRVDDQGDLVNVRQVAWLGPVGTVSFILIVGMALAFVARQALTWRRSSGDRRQQLKWLSAGGAVAILGVALSAAGLLPNGGGFGFTLLAIPVAMGIGILRYRLYDIDRLISRTLAYAIVTGILVGVYAGLVLVTTQALPVRLSGSVAVAGATLVAAALFSPLRRRVQHVVDRRFNRARYDAETTLAGFASRLKDEVDLETVRDDLAGVVRRTFEPASISLWLSESR